MVAGTHFIAPSNTVLRKHNDSLTRIADTYCFYDALQYPIMFWKGQEGYHFSILQTNPASGQPKPRKKVPCMDFYAFHLIVREHNSNLLLGCRTLLSQFLVDMYVKMESECLRFIALNQKKLCSENYIHLQDAIANDSNVSANN